MNEQMPPFEEWVGDFPILTPATEPLSEVEDLPSVPRGFISWADLERDWGLKAEQFDEDHDGAMSPVDEEPDIEEYIPPFE